MLSDITGVTGLQILRAIVAGERDAQTLGQLRDKRRRRSPAEIAKALTGNYRSEHIFALKQALAYDFYTAQIADCDAEMERQYAALQPIADAADLPPQTSRKRNSHSKNAPQFDARTQLFRITGVDLVAVTGLDESSVQTIISEIGTDVSRFPTVKHFCSWLTVVARLNDISGGKVLHSRTLKARNRAGQAFRMAAQAVMRTQTPFGAFYRRLAARIGKEQAIVATAHKIARVVYAMLKHQRPFESTSQEAYERQHQDTELKRLKRRAADLRTSNSYHSQDEPLTLKFLSQRVNESRFVTAIPQRSSTCRIRRHGG